MKEQVKRDKLVGCDQSLEIFCTAIFRILLVAFAHHGLLSINDQNELC
jgi:hypothetical protein